MENESEETDEHLRTTFKFLSVVDFLRQTLPQDVKEYVDEKIFLQESNVWNEMVGPIFRCDFLVNTSFLVS